MAEQSPGLYVGGQKERSLLSPWLSGVACPLFRPTSYSMYSVFYSMVTDPLNRGSRNSIRCEVTYTGYEVVGAAAPIACLDLRHNAA